MEKNIQAKITEKLKKKTEKVIKVLLQAQKEKKNTRENTC